MIGKEFRSILEILESFPNEQSCIKYLEQMRWEVKVISPFDKDSKIYKCQNNRYYCKNTGKYFNVKTNTLFEGSKISLRKWFVAIWLVSCHKKGISTRQLASDISVTQKTAWFMLQRIRQCFQIDDLEPKLDGEIEMDETFVGGKNKNRHRDKKVKQSQGRSFKDKIPVFGMLQRNGILIAQVIPNTSKDAITPVVLKRIALNATIYTDEWQGYDRLNNLYNRKFVDHGKGEYVNEEITTNRIEGFWSILKRGIIGVYHRTSKKHLQKYVDEFVWRYNIRKMNQSLRFKLFLCSKIERRLTYKELLYG